MSWKALKQIERIPNLSAEEFEERFLKSEEPVIAEGAVKDWPACRRWTLDFLADQLQSTERNVPVASWAAPFDSLSSFRIKRMPVAQYVANLRSGDSTWYGSNGWKFSIFPALHDDINTPAFLGRYRVSQRNLWFSGAGARFPTHYDSGSPYGLNAQITGAKTFRLVSGAFLSDMYPVPGGNFSHVCNLRTPDFDKFPRLRSVTCWEGTMQEGDVLFLPANWFHYVEHLGEFNVNLQFWFSHPSALRSSVNPIVVRDAVVSRLSPYGLADQADPSKKSFLQRLGAPEAFDSLVLLPLVNHFPSLVSRWASPPLRRMVRRKLQGGNGATPPSV